MDYRVNTKQQLEALNIDLLQGYLDTLGKGMIEKMFALYRQQTQLYLASIKAALMEDSDSSWQESCHKMKGAAASVGLTSLHGQLVILEKVKATKEEKMTYFTELTQENDKAMEIFEAWLVKVNEG